MCPFLHRRQKPPPAPRKLAYQRPNKWDKNKYMYAALYAKPHARPQNSDGNKHLLARKVDRVLTPLRDTRVMFRGMTHAPLSCAASIRRCAVTPATLSCRAASSPRRLLLQPQPGGLEVGHCRLAKCHLLCR